MELGETLVKGRVPLKEKQTTTLTMTIENCIMLLKEVSKTKEIVLV